MRFEPVIRRGVIPVLFAALLALPAPPAAAGDVPFGPAVVFDASAADGGDADNHALDDGGTVISVTGDGTFGYTLSGVISGSGDLVKTGDGRLVLGNAGNSYSGATIVSDGVLEIAGWNSINANSLRNEVTGSGELRSNGGLSIGNRGSGTLNIIDGGKVSAEGNILVGGGESAPNGIRGNGTVTVSGVGSELSSIGSIIVGDYGVGVLNITGGAKVSAKEVSLEPNTNAYANDSGTVLVGAGSELRVSGGGGENLAVRNGLLTGSGTIRLENGSNVTVNSGTISVGDHRGQIGELTIRGGDLRNNVNMYLRVDTAEDGSADHITITDGAFSTSSQNPLKMIIDLSSLNRVSNAPVITATGGITGLTTPGSVEFTLNGIAFNSIARVTGSASVGVVGNQLQLTTGFNAQNEKMTWTGHANGVDTDEWNQTDAKWTNSNDTLHTFLAGDWAVFDGSPSIALAIDQAVNASRMDVAAGMWVFRGDLTVQEDFWVGTPDNEADGKLHVTGGADVILYGDTLFSGGIEVAGNSSTLFIEKNNAYQFNDALTGDALVAFRMHGNELSFGAGVGSGAFTGTVALNNGDLTIDMNAETTLTNATLRLDSGGTASVSIDRALGGLHFNNGTLDMTAFNGSDVAPSVVLAVDELVNDGGSLTIDLASLNGIRAEAGDYDTLFDYSDDGSLYQKQIIEADNVSGAGALNLLDESGNSLATAQAVTRGINEGGDAVGNAVFDYTAGVNADGVYLGYGLTKVEAFDGKIVTLDTDGSTGDAVLTAQLTGDGGFVFTGTPDAAVGNTASDYTGATVIDATTVTMLTDNALGKTSGLDLSNGGTLDMDGKAQTVGGLAGGAGTSIDLGALTVDQAGNSTFFGNLLGAGSLTKDGSGVLTLSGANSYTGDTVINGGALALNGAGSLGSARLAMAGGTIFDFSGASAAPSSFARLDVLGAGATILGGGEILDLGGLGKTVAFDLAGVGAGEVMLDTATAQLDVSGAVLELNNLAAVSLTDGQRITLITNVLGDFANPDQYSSRNGRRTFGVERDGASVYLGVTVNSFLSSQNNGNVNLASGADYLDRLDAGGHPVTDLEDMWTPSQALGGRAADIALEQMYGGYAAYANAGLKAAGGRFRSLLQGRIAPDNLSPCFGSGLWASGFGSRADQNGAENLSGYDWDARGLALGYEHSFDSRLRAGVGAAYAKGALSVNDLRYENRPDVFNLAVYGVYAAPSGFFAQGSLGYGHAWNDYDVTMLLGGEKRGKYGSDGWFANLQLGYAAELPRGYNLIPSVGVEYDRVRNSGWEESVSGNPVLIANRFDSESDDSVALPFGLRFNKLFRFGRRGDQNAGYVVPEVRAAYVYNADAPRSSIGAGYAGAPGSAVMAGVAPGRSLWRLGAGVSGRFNERVDFRVDYDFEARAGYRGHSLTATLGVAF